MLNIRYPGTFPNASGLPALVETEAERELRLLGPTVYLDAKPDWLTGTDPAQGAATFKWLSRSGNGEIMVPGGTQKPRLVSFGNRHALRFGFGDGLSVGQNGFLKQASSTLLIPRGDRTIAYVGRVPVRAANGGSEAPGNTGGMFVSNPVNQGDQPLASYVNYTTGASANTTRLGAASTSVGSPTNFGDALWHTHAWTYDHSEADAFYYADSVQAGQFLAIANDIHDGDAFQLLMIGALGDNAIGINLVADLACVVILPMFCAGGSPEKAVLDAYLDEVKADLTA